MGFLSTALASVGSLFAGLGSSACIAWLFDEPECPKSLIK